MAVIYGFFLFFVAVVIGVDVTDQADDRIHDGQDLTEEPTYFDLSADQRAYWTTIQSLNNYLRVQYHALQDYVWKVGMRSAVNEFPSQ